MLQIILVLHLNTLSTVTLNKSFLKWDGGNINIPDALYSLTIRSFDGSQKKSFKIGTLEKKSKEGHMGFNISYYN